MNIYRWNYNLGKKMKLEHINEKTERYLTLNFYFAYW